MPLFQEQAQAKAEALDLRSGLRARLRRIFRRRDCKRSDVNEPRVLLEQPAGLQGPASTSPSHIARIINAAPSEADIPQLNESPNTKSPNTIESYSVGQAQGRAEFTEKECTTDQSLSHEFHTVGKCAELNPWDDRQQQAPIDGKAWILESEHKTAPTSRAMDWHEKLRVAQSSSFTRGVPMHSSSSTDESDGQRKTVQPAPCTRISDPAPTSLAISAPLKSGSKPSSAHNGHYSKPLYTWKSNPRRTCGRCLGLLECESVSSEMCRC